MEKDKDSTSFVPVIARLDRIDRVLQVLEENHSLSRKDCCGVETNNECKTLSSALEEVQHKGTLLERLALLEKRVLELSLEVDEENTSKSSCSTVQVSEMTADKYSESRKAENVEKASAADRIQKEIKSQDKCRGQKKKSQKKWLWLLRLRC